MTKPTLVVHRVYGSKERIFILCAPLLMKKTVPQSKEWARVTCPECIKLKDKLSLK